MLLRAFLNSIRGLREAFRLEAPVRLEVYALLPIIAVVSLAPLSALERAVMLLSYGLIIVTELLNTAIEKAVDRISLDLHPLSKIAKDVASAAVFVSILLCVIVWLLILYPKFQ